MSEHGTYSRYIQGCRCNECTAASAAYKRKRVAERRREVAASGLPSSVTHGHSAYNNWSCRCDICTAAQRDYLRARKGGGCQACGLLVRPYTTGHWCDTGHGYAYVCHRVRAKSLPEVIS
jgi:hypothetical protein